MLAHPRLAEMQYFKYNPARRPGSHNIVKRRHKQEMRPRQDLDGTALSIRRERNGVPRRFRARQRHERPAADAAVETRTKPCEREGFQHKGGAYCQRLLGIGGAGMSKRRRKEREHLWRRKTRLRETRCKVNHGSARRSMLRVEDDALTGVNKTHFFDDSSPTP